MKRIAFFIVLLLAIAAMAQTGNPPFQIVRNGGFCRITTTGAVQCNAKTGTGIAFTGTTFTFNGSPVGGGGGGGSPGGLDTQVQFNDSGAFSGDAGLIYNKTTNVLTELNPGIGTTSTDGIVLSNTTPAAVGAQQFSPRLHFIGQGWKTNSGGAAQTVDWIIENQPIQGTAIAGSNLVVSRQANGGGYTVSASFGNSSFSVPGGTLFIGTAGTSTGSLGLVNAATANITYLQGGNAASSLVFVWPIVNPTAGQALLASAPSGGIVTLSWGAPAAPGLTTQLIYNNGGVEAGDVDLTFNNASKALTVGGSITGATLNVTSNLFTVNPSGVITNYNGGNPAAGSLLIGTGSPGGFSNATLTQGANVAITNGAGTITVACCTGGLVDVNGNSMLAFTPTASAVDAFRFTNAATANPATVTLAAVGTDANIILALTAKGTGWLQTVTPIATPRANAPMIFDVLGSGASTAELFSMGSSQDGGVKHHFYWDRYCIGNVDACIARNAAGVLEVNNGTVGQWAVEKNGVRDAGTTTITTGIITGHQSTGTPAANFGSGLLFNANSNTTADQNAGEIAAAWSVATHASRTAYLDFQLVNNATALASKMRLSGAGGLCINCTSDPGAGVLQVNTSVLTPIIKPGSDSTTAIQITKADGTTRIMDFDTTNARVGINKTPGAFDLDVNGAVNFASTLAVTGAITPSQTAGIVGTTTNNNANAGSAGEVVTANVVAGSAVSLTTNTTANVTSISLTAGDWDVTGVVDFQFGATTSYSNVIGGTSTTSATLDVQDTFFDFEIVAQVPTAGHDDSWVVPTRRLSLSGTTTVFLVAQGTFTVSTLKAYGTIRARRVR